MGKILEAFAGDELHVIPSKEIRSPKRQELCDKACELQEKLEEKLNIEEKKLLNELMDAIADENCCYAQSKLIHQRISSGGADGYGDDVRAGNILWLSEAGQKQILSLDWRFYMARLDYGKVTLEKVSVCGMKCEFSGMRIDQNTVPEGKYQYEVAGDDESGGEPVRVKQGILVNFFGTLICSEPLPIGDDGILWLMDGDVVWL